MDEIGAYLRSPGWWFTTVLIGILSSLIANQIQTHLVDRANWPSTLALAKRLTLVTNWAISLTMAASLVRFGTVDWQVLKFTNIIVFGLLATAFAGLVVGACFESPKFNLFHFVFSIGVALILGPRGAFYDMGVGFLPILAVIALFSVRTRLAPDSGNK